MLVSLVAMGLICGGIAVFIGPQRVQAHRRRASRSAAVARPGSAVHTTTAHPRWHPRGWARWVGSAHWPFWLTGVLAVAVCQRLPLWRARFLLPVLAVAGLLAAAVTALARLPAEEAARVAGATGAGVILSVVMVFVLAGAFKRINVYDAFIDGAKEGFGVAIQIVPYLIAILIAIGVFRAAGCMDFLLSGIGAAVAAMGWNTDFLPALPVGLMKVLSGAGARGLMIDVMQVHGVDSFPGRLAAIVQGSTETTFYVLAVYFGSVGIQHARHALACALVADAVGLAAAIGVGYAMLR